MTYRAFVPPLAAPTRLKQTSHGCTLSQILQASLRLSLGVPCTASPALGLSFNTSPATVSSVIPYAPFVQPIDGPAVAAPSPHTVLVWFRSDLRLHDNQALAHAIELAGDAGRIIPVYIFDTRAFGKTSFGFEKTGRYRAKFLIQSVQTLKNSLQSLASDLVVRVGQPASILTQLCQSLNVDKVVAHTEVSLDDSRHDDSIKSCLDEIGIEFQTIWGNTLYAKEDLPFHIEDLPDVYAKFRHTVQTRCQVRRPLDAPKRFPSLPSHIGTHPTAACPVGQVPTLKQLGLSDPAETTSGSVGPTLPGFNGGESEALQRLAEYVQECDNNANSHSFISVDTDFSCKISPWLSLGCVSPRKIYADLGQTHAKTAQSTAYYELVWRDFFRFVTAKYSTSGRKTNARKTQLSGAVEKSSFKTPRKFSRSLVGAGL